jgi:aryl carrier-like protein
MTLELHFPAYMLPDVIILMPGFPENNNGKMDFQRMLELVKNGFDGLDFDNELLSIFKKKDLIFKGLKGNQSFTSQGGDSILGLRLVGKMKKMGYQIEISDLLNAPTLNECFDKIKSTQNFTKEVSENTIHLSPVQKWFLKEYTGNRNHFNQSVLLELFLPMSESEIYEKVSHCFNSIDILQKVFDGNWKLGKAPIFEFIEINSNEEITAHCEKFQRSFNLSEGPVSAVVIFKSLDSLFLFISIHHFYCDGVTWRILMDHLQDSLSGTETNNTDTNIYGRVLTACTELGNEDEKSSYYSKKAFNPFNHLKVSSYQDSEFRSIEWDIERSQVFQRVWNTGLSMNEKFVNFFLHSWLGANQEQTAIYLETHGRQYSGIPEIAETIGWFTQFYPLSEIDYPRNEAEIFDYVKQSFSNLPNQGLGYMGVGSWQKPPFPVLLNFLGSFDENWNSMARPVFHDQSNQVDPLNPMLAFFEVNGIIMEGKIKWMFRSHPEIPIDKIVEEWESTAKKILMNQDSSFYSDESIDKDDINRISDMLDILDL